MGQNKEIQLDGIKITDAELKVRIQEASQSGSFKIVEVSQGVFKTLKKLQD